MGPVVLVKNESLKLPGKDKILTQCGTANNRQPAAVTFPKLLIHLIPAADGVIPITVLVCKEMIPIRLY